MQVILEFFDLVVQNLIHNLNSHFYTCMVDVKAIKFNVT